MNKDEAKQFLSNLITEINNQDNRITASPYYYVVKGKGNKETNIFFSEKACTEHMKANAHHYVGERSFVKHAWRNPEIENLFKAISSLSETPLDWK